MRNKEAEEAIDILQNCIADYVIGDFCVGKYCPMENECKDKDCPFNTAIDKVIAYISELEEELDSARRKNESFKNQLDECIHEDVIRDKIKELEHEKSKRTQLGVFMLKNYENQKLLAQIEVLKSIIGE